MIDDQFEFILNIIKSTHYPLFNSRIINLNLEALIKAGFTNFNTNISQFLLKQGYSNEEIYINFTEHCNLDYIIKDPQLLNNFLIWSHNQFFDSDFIKLLIKQDLENTKNIILAFQRPIGLIQQFLFFNILIDYIMVYQTSLSNEMQIKVLQEFLPYVLDFETKLGLNSDSTNLPWLTSRYIKHKIIYAEGGNPNLYIDYGEPIHTYNGKRINFPCYLTKYKIGVMMVYIKKSG